MVFSQLLLISSNKNYSETIGNMPIYYETDKAKTSRSTCVGCGVKIEKDELRVARADYRGPGGHWFHPLCLGEWCQNRKSSFRHILNVRNIKGYDKQSFEDQRCLRNMVGSIVVNPDLDESVRVWLKGGKNRTVGQYHECMKVYKVLVCKAPFAECDLALIEGRIALVAASQWVLDMVPCWYQYGDAILALGPAKASKLQRPMNTNKARRRLAVAFCIQDIQDRGVDAFEKVEPNLNKRPFFNLKWLMHRNALIDKLSSAERMYNSYRVWRRCGDSEKSTLAYNGALELWNECLIRR